MFLILLILFTLIPAIEIYLLFSIGGTIGGLNTLLIVILTGIAGAALAKSQGLSIIGRIQDNLSEGKVPAREFIHGLLVFGGGLLLLTPGFMTDIIGLLMVAPGSRNLIARLLQDMFSKGIIGNNTTFYSSTHFQNKRTKNKEVGPDVFEAEFHETQDIDN